MWIVWRALIVCGLWLIPALAAGLLPHTPGDTGLGLGLMVMLAQLVVSLVWAFADGRRARRPFPVLLLGWAVVAIASAILSVFLPQLGNPRIDLDVLRSDLMLAPMGFLLTFVPALIGLGISGAIRALAARRRPDSASQPPLRP